MIKKGVVFLLALFCSQSMYAEPLKVAITVEDPPFIYMATKNLYYGFDISLVKYICNKINRPCQFETMPFKNIINNVATGKVDVAVSSITMTPERANFVRFSIPYLPGYCQFMTNIDFKSPYSLSTLQANEIGYVEGSLFPEVLNGLGVTGSKIAYADERSLVEALISNEIQIILADEPSVKYWVNNSSGKLKALGAPFKYGLGIAMAIRPDQPELLDQINTVLKDYLNSEDYKNNYRLYFQN